MDPPPTKLPRTGTASEPRKFFTGSVMFSDSSDLAESTIGDKLENRILRLRSLGLPALLEAPWRALLVRLSLLGLLRKWHRNSGSKRCSSNSSAQQTLRARRQRILRVPLRLRMTCLLCLRFPDFRIWLHRHHLRPLAPKHEDAVVYQSRLARLRDTLVCMTRAASYSAAKARANAQGCGRRRSAQRQGQGQEQGQGQRKGQWRWTACSEQT